MILTQLLFIFICSFSAYAGRPLITDDSEVIGKRNLQLETWLFADKRSLQHWVLPTAGFGDFEANLSAVHGTTWNGPKARTYSASGPIIQGKYRLNEANSWDEPGFAISGGWIAPYGTGVFKSQTWDYFFYGAMTSELIPEVCLLHLNIGQQTRRQLNNSKPIFLWGVALEYLTFEKTFTFVETSNGDVFALNPGIAAQTGLRYDLTDTFQIDGTVGTGLSGNPKLPYWVTVGIKTLTDF